MFTTSQDSCRMPARVVIDGITCFALRCMYSTLNKRNKWIPPFPAEQMPLVQQDVGCCGRRSDGLIRNNRAVAL
jgi:hypothetical protein